jgi:hypothetical protein
VHHRRCGPRYAGEDGDHLARQRQQRQDHPDGYDIPTHRVVTSVVLGPGQVQQTTDLSEEGGGVTTGHVHGTDGRRAGLDAHRNQLRLVVRHRVFDQRSVSPAASIETNFSIRAARVWGRFASWMR